MFVFKTIYLLKGFCRIGTCRKKVMGLLRLMGNKADVVKGLAKRCNENWSIAPKSDIVRSVMLDIRIYLTFVLFTGPIPFRYSSKSNYPLLKERL